MTATHDQLQAIPDADIATLGHIMHRLLNDDDMYHDLWPANPYRPGSLTLDGHIGKLTHPECDAIQHAIKETP